MSNNAFNRFKSLVGSNPTDVISITSNNGDGTSNGTTLAGDSVNVKGESVTVGNKAYIRGGEIISSAPNHSITEVTV